MRRNRVQVVSTVVTLLGAAALVAVCVLRVAADTHAPRQAGSQSMVLFGSSSMNGIFGHLIAKDFAQLGFQVTRKGYSAAGLARPDFRDLPQIFDTFPIERSTSVLLYIGGNDAQSLWLRPQERTGRDTRPWVSWRDERWSSIYERRMTDLIDSACERGAEHVFVLPPADVNKHRLQTRLERVRKAQQHAVKATKCGRYIATMGDRGHFQGRVLRAPDGVHMNRSGALKVWGRAREQVFALLGYSAQLQPCDACTNTHGDSKKRRVQRGKAIGRRAQRGGPAILLTDLR